MESFLNYLEYNFNINKNNIFIYEIKDEEYKILITFKITLNNGERIDIKKHFPNSAIINKKGNALYTINALNLLIKSTNTELTNLDDLSKIKVDWNLYQDKIITLLNKELSILDITRVFS